MPETNAIKMALHFMASKNRPKRKKFDKKQKMVGGKFTFLGYCILLPRFFTFVSFLDISFVSDEKSDSNFSLLFSIRAVLTFPIFPPFPQCEWNGNTSLPFEPSKRWDNSKRQPLTGFP